MKTRKYSNGYDRDFYDEDVEYFEKYSLEEDEVSDYVTNGFTQVPNRVLTDSRISIQARLLYNLLLSHCWDKDFCFPTQKRLAEQMGLKERRIYSLLKELESKKYIEIHRHGYQNPNVYELLILPEGKTYKKRYKEIYGKKQNATLSKVKKPAKNDRSKRQKTAGLTSSKLPTNNKKEERRIRSKKTKKRGDFSFLYKN